MALFGYIPKHANKALWRTAFPDQISPTKTKSTATKPRKPIPRTQKRISPISAAARPDRRLYAIEARQAVLEAVKRGERDPWGDVPEEVHHIFGKRGKLRRWRPGWLLTGRRLHDWIETHPKEAQDAGWRGPTGTFNDFERAQEAIKHPPFSG